MGIQLPIFAPFLPSPPHPQAHWISSYPIHTYTGPWIQPTSTFLLPRWPLSWDWALLSSLGQSPTRSADQPPMTLSLSPLQTWVSCGAGGLSGLEQPSFGVSKTEIPFLPLFQSESSAYLGQHHYLFPFHKPLSQCHPRLAAIGERPLGLSREVWWNSGEHLILKFKMPKLPLSWFFATQQKFRS